MQLVLRASQMLLMGLDKPLDGFGSLLSNFAETLIGHVFHPEASFGDNMLIIDQERDLVSR